MLVHKDCGKHVWSAQQLVNSWSAPLFYTRTVSISHQHTDVEQAVPCTFFQVSPRNTKESFFFKKILLNHCLTVEFLPVSMILKDAQTLGSSLHLIQQIQRAEIHALFPVKIKSASLTCPCSACLHSSLFSQLSSNSS